MANGLDNDLRQRIAEQGRVSFGTDWSPQHWTIAPGRLELLGNHVDYNGGLVLAGAVDRVVATAIDLAGTADRLAIVAGDVSPDVFQLDPESAMDWRNSDSETGPREYGLGILAALMGRGMPIRRRARVSIAGNVPLGFGMSSSAGLCVALTLALAEDQLDSADLVAIAQEAEHRAGSPVGAMDQSASVAGGVILFDGSDTSFRRLSPDLGDYVFAVADSGVHHAIGTSAYPRRVDESRRALTLLQEHVTPQLNSLGELGPEQWAAIQSDHPALLDHVLMRRVEHVVSEVHRVRQGVSALEAGEWERFGVLMTASGRSSAANYEISHPQVERLVDDLLAMPGVLGARMMGGGEGGPALALLHGNAVAEVADTLDAGYFSEFPSSPGGGRFQVCVFGEGARKR